MARKLKFFKFFGGSFLEKIFSLDLQDPIEERTPKWDNFEDENCVWGKSESLSIVLVVMD